MIECKKCKSKNVYGVENLGDYDGVSYYRCNDCGFLYHRFAECEFTDIRWLEKYGPTYYFNKGELVAFSIHRAEGLNIENLKEGADFKIIK